MNPTAVWCGIGLVAIFTGHPIFGGVVIGVALLK